MYLVPILAFSSFTRNISALPYPRVSRKNRDGPTASWSPPIVGGSSVSAASNPSFEVVRIIDEHCVAHPEADQITRPLQMADFAALLQRIEVRLGHA